MFHETSIIAGEWCDGTRPYFYSISVSTNFNIASTKLIAAENRWLIDWKIIQIRSEFECS